MKIIILLFLLLCGSIGFHAQVSLTLYPTINSVGFQVDFPSTFDADSNARCLVKYAKAGEIAVDGFPASRINKYGNIQYRGSLFQLEAATKYYVTVTLVDSFPVLQSFTLMDSIVTRAEPAISATANVKYVSPTGSGTSYTEANPGNLKTLLNGGLSCGTTVLLKGGNYSTGGITLNLTQDCSATNPIVIMAAPGETPILDGGDYTQYVWTQDGSDPDLYWASIKPELKYNSLCLMDSVRLYPYAFKTPWVVNPSYPCLSELDYELSGFYRNNKNVVYIKTVDHKDPNNSTIIFSKYFNALKINGNNHQNHLYIKGISFKNYGKGSCDTNFLGDPINCYPSYTISLENANNTIIDSCSFADCNVPLSFNDLCNRNIVQECNFTDGIGEWSHAAFKQSRDYIVPLPLANYEAETVGGTMGRYLEYAAINLRPDSLSIFTGNIIRNNVVKGTVGGLVGEFFAVTGYNRAIEETDISNNKVSFCYNGINADGGSISSRIWSNEISDCSVGISFIDAWMGPNYLFKNSIHHIIERKNYPNDPSFLDCNADSTSKSWGTGIKINAVPKKAIPPEIFVVNNTFHAQDSIAFPMYLWERTWKGFHSYNNIFYSEGMSSLLFDGIKDSSDYTFDSHNDCYFNPNTGVVAIIRPVHGNPLCLEYNSGAELGSGLNAVTQSTAVSVSGELNVNPDFVNANSDWHLQETSALIDQGILVPGINHLFKDSGPDVGAYESDLTVNLKEKIKNTGLRIYPNPSDGIVWVSGFSTADKKITIFNSLGQVKITTTAEGQQAELNLKALQPGIYFLKHGEQCIPLILR